MQNIIKITQKAYLDVIKHVLDTPNIESCGYIGEKNGILSKVWKMTNIDNSPTHYSFSPKEQISVLKESKKKGFLISAVYHSHLNSKPFPSKEDIRLAYDPNMIYIIVSLIGKNVTLKAFNIKNCLVHKLDIIII